jgi:hypothetical protein
MPLYLQNLLPRLREFSQSLEKKEMLIDQPWILTGDVPNKQQFIFRRDGQLIQSVNGDVETGTWEYIAAAQSLLIQSNSIKILLNHAFFDKGVLLLKKDGSSDAPWILANKNIIPDLDVESYLKKLVAKKQQLGWIKLDSGEEIEFEDPFSSGIKQGSAVKLNGSNVPDGIYNTENNNLILTIHDSTVTQLISKTVYSTDKGDIIIHEILELDPSIRKGLKVWSGQYPAANGRYTFKDDDINAKYIDVQNGIISKVKYGINEGLVATLLVFGVLFLFLLIFIIFGAQHQ